MFYMDNNTSNENGLSAPTLTKAVEMIAACSNDLMIVAEAIMQSCNLVENLEEAHRDVLVCRTDTLKRLALVYKSRSARLEQLHKSL